MSNGFELARGLMQLSSLSEQREARKEELRFRKMYEAPLKEAYTRYYNTLEKKAADPILQRLEKELAEAKITGAEAESGISQLLFNKISSLMDSKDPGDQKLASNYLFKIDESKAFRDQIAAFTLKDQQSKTQIQALAEQRQMDALKFKRIESGLGFLADPRLRDKAEDITGDQLLDIIETNLLESFFGTKIPKQPRDEGFFEKLFKRKDQFPSEGKFSKAKPKPAPTKAPEKKEGAASAQFTTDETAAIYEKARENDVNPLDIAAGVQRLVETFPDLDRNTLLEAHNLLAEGVPIEDIERYINERSEK